MDAIAKTYLSVELYTKKDAFAWTLLRGLVRAPINLLLQEISTGVPTIRAWVVVRDRWSGDLVYWQEYKYDVDAANLDKETIEGDLADLSLEEFLTEYGIDWEPPESKPEQSG